MIEQQAYRVLVAITIDRVGVEVAGEHEGGIRRQATTPAAIVVQPVDGCTGQVLGPKPDLIVVAQAVAVFRAIEHRRCRLRDQEMEIGRAEWWARVCKYV